MLILSTKVDKKSLEAEFFIAICRLAIIFDPHSSIVKSILDCRLSGLLMHTVQPAALMTGY